MQKIIFFAITFMTMVLTLTGCATGSFTNNEGSTRVVSYKHDMGNTQAMYIAGSTISGDHAIINKGDAFSVRLLSAFICDFRELSGLVDLVAISNRGTTNCLGGDGGQHAGTRGEIAIAANVGERKNGGGLTFDPSNIKNGRVIYYNEDIRETGQLINALNLPVYGPKTYDGKPFYMDWSVMELDNKENAAARKLLKQLADIGTLPAAPSTPVLKLLNALGGALIDANNDDLEMHYQMETDPKLDCAKLGSSCDDLTVNRMPLREGYYAFIRSEDRSAFIEPDQMNMRVCEDIGILCEQVFVETMGTTTPKPWQKNTWLLVRVAREDKDAALDQDDAQTSAELQTVVELINSLNTHNLPSNEQVLSDALKSVSDNVIKNREKQKLESQLQKLELKKSLIEKNKQTQDLINDESWKGLSLRIKALHEAIRVLETPIVP